MLSLDLSASSALLLTTYVAALAMLYGAFNATVLTPYMDEPFHVGQTQAYCAGHWSAWDDKITTFPGLYACVASVARALGKVGAFFSFIPDAPEKLCTLPALRAANLLPAFVTPLILHALFRALHPGTSTEDAFANALVLSLLPTHFFFHFLYYTDSAATAVNCKI